MTVPSLMKLTWASFRSILETDIKFEHEFGVFRASFKITFWLTLIISIKNCIDSLSDIMKVKSLSAEKSVSSELYRVYEVNRDLSVKQWSLSPKSIKVKTSFNIFILVWSTISSSNNYFLSIFFSIPLSILCSTYSMELGDSVVITQRS